MNASEIPGMTIGAAIMIAFWILVLMIAVFWIWFPIMVYNRLKSLEKEAKETNRNLAAQTSYLKLLNDKQAKVVRYYEAATPADAPHPEDSEEPAV